MGQDSFLIVISLAIEEPYTSSAIEGQLKLDEEDYIDKD